MSSYNLEKVADRDRIRKERAEELLAVQEGRWPRDIDDLLRWSRRDALYAGHMCKIEIAYIDDLEKRIARGDSDLWFFEKRSA